MILNNHKFNFLKISNNKIKLKITIWLIQLNNNHLILTSKILIKWCTNLKIFSNKAIFIHKIIILNNNSQYFFRLNQNLCLKLVAVVISRITKKTIIITINYKILIIIIKILFFLCNNLVLIFRYIYKIKNRRKNKITLCNFN